MNELELLLQQWANFYLIMSAAASTLIGLLFVVITLAAQRWVKKVEATAKIGVYVLPSVVSYVSVLGIAALMTFPNHTRLTATLCICLLGFAGVVLSGSILIGGDKNNYEKRRDLIPHSVFPLAAYLLLVLGGVVLLHDPRCGLIFVAVGMLSLLMIAIRNTMAMAIGVTSTHHDLD